MFGVSFGRRKTARVVPASQSLVTGAAPLTLSAGDYQSLVTTGGTNGNETVNLPTGDYPGQRKFVKLATRTATNDRVVFGVTNIRRGLIVTTSGAAIASLTLNVNQYALFEWSGAFWNLIYTDGTIA